MQIMARFYGLIFSNEIHTMSLNTFEAIVSKSRLLDLSYFKNVKMFLVENKTWILKKNIILGFLFLQ